MALSKSISSLPVILLSGDANQSLTSSQSGSLCLLNTALTGARTLTIPSPSVGLNFIILNAYTGGALGNTMTSSANVRGSLITATPSTVAKAGATFQFTATSVSGDIVYLYSDGINWYCFGSTRAAAGLA